MNTKKLKSKVYRNLATMNVQEYWKYLDEVAFGYIERHVHPENENLVFLHYTPKAIQERRFNDEVMTAGDLIFDITNANINGIVTLLSTPSKGFQADAFAFTSGYQIEPDDDGPLTSYFYEGEMRFASRQGFDTDLTRTANDLWKQAHQLHHDMSYFATFPSTYTVRIRGGQLALAGVSYTEMQEFMEYPETEIAHEAMKLHMTVA